MGALVGHISLSPALCFTDSKILRGVSKESEKSPQVSFRLFLDSFETPGRTLSGLLGSCPGVLCSDSSGVLGPKGPGDPVWGGADCKRIPM